MNRFPRNQLAVVGLLIVAALVLASTYFVPDTREVVAERYTLMGLLVVSGVAQWRGTRAGLIAALGVFLLLGALRGLAPYSMPYRAREDVFFDLGLFLAIASVQGIATGDLARREKTAEDNERGMAAVNRLSTALMPSRDVDPSVLLEGVCSALSLDRLALLLVDPDGKPAPENEEDVRWFDRHPDGLALAEEVAEACSEQLPEGCPARRSATLHTIDIAAPLVSGGRFFGVLYARYPRRANDGGGSQATCMELASHSLAAFLARTSLERDVAEARAIEASNRLKASLVSSVSHELKTPLAAATATVSGLLEGETMTGSMRIEIQAAKTDLDLLNARIVDLLDLALLETETWEPAIDWNDLRDVFSSLMGDLSAADRERVRLAEQVTWPIVRVDVVQLTRAMRHLLENALAYSPLDSTVTLGATVDGDRLRVWVEDHGPGVDPSERCKVFEKFYRGETSRLAPHGTGLGLAIASEIARSHGGSIEIEDVEPQGARFVVDLPIEAEG